MLRSEILHQTPHILGFYGFFKASHYPKKVAINKLFLSQNRKMNLNNIPPFQHTSSIHCPTLHIIVKTHHKKYKQLPKKP
jgi:hypothetical protein